QAYALRDGVMSSLARAGRTNRVPRQTVVLARDYGSVPPRWTGTEGGRELLAREMQREMTASILRRIDAASRAPMPVGMPVEPAPPSTGQAQPADVPAAAPADTP